MISIDKFLNHLSKSVLKHSLFIIAIFPIIAVFLVFYIINNLEMNTDTRDMLSEKLDWRQLDIEYESLFPHVVDNLIIVVEAETPDESEDYATLLNIELMEHKDLFKSLYYFKDQEFFKKSSLLYLETDELYDLSDTLANYQPFLSRLVSDQSLGGFLSLLTEAIEEKNNNDSIKIEPLLSEFNKTIYKFNNNQHYRFSWQSLLSNNTSNNKTFREIIVTQPYLNYSELFPADEIIQKIHALAKKNGITKQKNMSVKLTGSVALAHEEFKSASKANLIAIISSLVLVTILLIIGLGSYKLVLITLICLLIGLIYTAAFATFAIGELNLISIAFAVLYIGLGVDFSIHYCLNYKNNVKHSNKLTQNNTIHITNTTIGRPLLLCAITTAMGFLSFLITDYKGVAELGLIAGFGMFTSLFITLIFMPALLKYISVSFTDSTNKNINSNSYLNLPEQHSKTIIFISLILTLISLSLVSYIRFDYDLLNIQPKSNESVKTFKELLSDETISPLRNIVVSDSHKNISHIEDLLLPLDSVLELHSIDSYIPKEQDEKLIIIDELNLLLGDIFNATNKNSYELLELKKRILDLDKLLEDGANDDYQNTKVNLQTLLENLNQSDDYQSDIHKIEKMLFASLSGRLLRLSNSLEAETLSLENLPKDFKSRWMNNAKYLVEVLPKKNLSDTKELQTFVNETQSVVKNITGPPVVSIEAGNAVINAFKQAFIAAFIAVTLFLLILLKSKWDVIFILIPLLLASLFTAAVAVIFDIPLNFANIIALPLLFGIGVDSAIHIVNQHHHKDTHSLLESSSAKAIFISALTTMLSIGNLALSEHPGTASMGLLLVIGISFALLCTLAITPALLTIRSKKSSRHP